MDCRIAARVERRRSFSEAKWIRAYWIAQQTSRDLHVSDASGVQFAVHEHRWRLWEQPGQPAHLFDFTQLGEPVDQAAQHADVIERLREALDRRSRAARRRGSATRKALRELGYVGDR